MRRPLFFLALMLVSAVPIFAQKTELGVLVGASRRFVEEGLPEDAPDLLDSDFSLSNSSVDLFWATPLDDDTYLKFKVGRIQSQLAFEDIDDTTDPETIHRRDAEGEVQHASMAIEYRFREPYGSTGVFGGLGFYRQSADDPEVETTNNWGYHAGVSADFPLSQRYGVILEGTYHWSRAAFRPRYLTVGAGLRIAF